MIIFRQNSLFTVEILYYRPDYKTLLQSFLWQTEDFDPDMPRIHGFLNFWHNSIEATINSITVMKNTSGDWRKVDIELK